MSFIQSLIGQRFGRLVVIDKSDRTDGHTSWWVCKCDCGNIKEVRASCLKKGSTKSCGCLRREMGVEHGRKMLTHHGMYGTRLYIIWRGIKSRCNNKNAENYKYYGAKGVKICDEWDKDFISFVEWAMANGYKDNLTIDRIDVNGNYEPSNCRWISNDEQQRNRRNNRFVTIDGITKCVSEWARELGVSRLKIVRCVSNGICTSSEIMIDRRKVRT